MLCKKMRRFRICKNKCGSMTWFFRYMHLKITLIYPSTTTTAAAGPDLVSKQYRLTCAAKRECAPAPLTEN